MPLKQVNYLYQFREELRNSITTLPVCKYESKVDVRIWGDFRPSRKAPLFDRSKRAILGQIRKIPFPKNELVFLNKDSRHAPWVCYLAFAPNGFLQPRHKFTISRLKDSGFNVLLVFSCVDRAQCHALSSTLEEVDGLVWKDIPGFDFSAYYLGCRHLVRVFSTVDLVLLNDSVLGPVTDLLPIMQSSPWEVTGMTSALSVECHIQSYCVVFKAFDAQSLECLSRLVSESLCFNTHSHVCFHQETALARVFSTNYSVGSLVQPATIEEQQFNLGNPEGLLQIGFPFLKASLFGKFQQVFDQDYYRNVAITYGIPANCVSTS